MASTSVLLILPIISMSALTGQPVLCILTFLTLLIFLALLAALEASEPDEYLDKVVMGKRHRLHRSVPSGGPDRAG